MHKRDEDGGPEFPAVLYVALRETSLNNRRMYMECICKSQKYIKDVHETILPHISEWEDHQCKDRDAIR